MLHEVAHAALLCRLHWLQPNVLMSYLGVRYMAAVVCSHVIQT